MSKMSIPLARLKSPDFMPVQWLSFIKALLQIILLVLRTPTKESFRLAGLILQVKAGYTMVSVPRLENLYMRVKDANHWHLNGDIVECGSWHGGSSAVMARAGIDSGVPRISWVFDSFKGLPPPGDKDGQFEHDFFYDGWCKGETEKVRSIFRQVGVPSERLKIVPGWFQNTLPKIPIEQIAILHVDADWYDSVKLVLETLYQRVIPNGFIIIDDYYVWAGCKQAVDEFMTAQNIPSGLLQNVGGVAVYFQKPN